MKNPLSVAAPVLQPIDSASIYERQGQFALEPLLEKKQKRQQAEGEFAGVMAQIEKFSSEGWEQDWQVLSQMKEQFMDTAAKAYETAYMEGRDMSVMERYQIQKGLGEIQSKAQISAENKKVYDYWSKEIVKNPDKYDVQASLGLLNQGYRDRALGERNVDNFLVQRFDESEFLKGIKAPTITKSHEGVRGGKTVTEADVPAIQRNVMNHIQSNPQVLERFSAMSDEQQIETFNRWVQAKVDEVNRTIRTSTKAFQAPYTITTTTAPEVLSSVFGTKEKETIQIKATGESFIYNDKEMLAHSIMRDDKGELMLIAYVPIKENNRNTGRYTAEAIPLRNVEGHVVNVTKDENIIKAAENLPKSGGGTPTTTTTSNTGKFARYSPK